MIDGTLDAANKAIAATTDGANEQDAALVNKWQKRLSSALKHDEAPRKNFADDRRVARGVSEWMVDTNLVNAIIEILCAFIYAKDPDLSATPSPSVGNTHNKELKEVCETLQVLISRLIRDAGLKRQAKRWVRSTCTVGPGWLSTGMQTRRQKVPDPIIESQINDLAENLKRVSILKQNLADGEVGDEDAQEAEIEANMKALEAKLERNIATGLFIDYYAAEDILVSPECGELVNYLNAPWIRKRTYKSQEEAQDITGWSAEVINTGNRYRQRDRGQDGNDASGPTTQWIVAEGSEAPEGFFAFDEVWSKRDGVVYTFVDGVNDRFARASYAPITGSRFYDVFLLGFHYIDGERYPQSDTQQLKKLQDEYARTRSNFAEHRKRSIPCTIWDAGEVNPTQLEKINSAEVGENVAVYFTTPSSPIGNKFMKNGGGDFNPMMYSTDQIRSDMEKVSGAQDAMQASVSVAKTATEAGIQNEGFGARIGVRKDEVDSVLSDMMLFIAQISMQTLTEDFVVRVCGSGAVWPQLSIDEIMYAFNIEVRAGSTGKPNTAAKRAAWSTMLPLLEKMVVAIGNFRNAGQEWAAQPYVAMLKYTGDVLEMKDDIEQFIPQAPPPDPMAQVMGAITGQPTPPPMQSMMDAIGTPAPEVPITS